MGPKIVDVDQASKDALEYAKRIAGVFEDNEHPATVVTALQLVVALILEDLDVPTEIFAAQVDKSRREEIARARKKVGF